ncbi:MAG: LuxR C-terminal-related transcriptional regulator [Acidimicrobiales bacterium]
MAVGQCLAPFDRRLQLDGSEITVVTGPPGYGKTTLLAQWYRTLRRSGARPIWHTIDPTTVEVHDRGFDELLRSSIDAVADGDGVLFIDDLHHADQWVIDQLTEWFNGLEGGRWQLILASRATINVPPHTASDQTPRQIGPNELRLDDQEVDRALRDIAPDLAPWQTVELVDRIDGWPAGLDLVGRILATEQQITAPVGELVDSHWMVADYFERESFTALPDSDKDFLVRSSVVARPSSEVCDQVDGVTCSADHLARLSYGNTFVFSAENGTALRWAPMGRAFLLGRLRALGQGHEQATRQRVLRWLVDQRRYDEATTQAAETDDWFVVVDLVLETGLDIVGSGRADDLISWLDRLPAEVVMAESGVAVLAAMALWVQQGDVAGQEIDRWLKQAASSRRGRPPSQAESLSAAIDAAQAAFGQLGPRTRKLIAERALRAEAPSDTPWAALAHAAIGLASYLDDEPREARRALTESLRIQTRLDVEPRRCMTRLFSPTALGVLALIELESGGYDDRADALISAAELQDLRNSGPAPGAGIIGLAKSRSALAAGDHKRALELALQTGRTAHTFAIRALGFLDAASIHCEQGRADASMRCLADADRLLARDVDVGRLLTQRRRAIERQVKLGRAARGSSVDLLTEREAEVLRLLDSDLSRREIAEELYLSFETVKTYVQRLYQKLGVSSRAAAVATAHAWGWIDELDRAEAHT